MEKHEALLCPKLKTDIVLLLFGDPLFNVKSFLGEGKLSSKTRIIQGVKGYDCSAKSFLGKKGQ